MCNMISQKQKDIKIRKIQKEDIEKNNTIIRAIFYITYKYETRYF